jgi:hypothetical protein
LSFFFETKIQYDLPIEFGAKRRPLKREVTLIQQLAKKNKTTALFRIAA